MREYLPLFLLFVFLFVPGRALTNSDLQNWFHDPFFQISNAIPDCPMPAGPFIDAKQRQAAAHHRSERGTTCWLEGKCNRPSSYDYDQDIANAFKDALLVSNPFEESTLWVTVQGRVVFIEGCATEKSITTELETFAMALPYVQVAVAKIRFDPSEESPYVLFDRE